MNMYICPFFNCTNTVLLIHPTPLLSLYRSMVPLSLFPPLVPLSLFPPIVPLALSPALVTLSLSNTCI